MLSPEKQQLITALETVYEAAGKENPKNIESLQIEDIRAEIKEMATNALSTNERERIHYPPLIEIARLENSSRIMGIDFRCIPGHTSKAPPMDNELEQKERNGEISPKKTPTLIIHSSGNAAIWFTKIARQKGYKVIVVTFDYANEPRLNALTALGAEIVYTRGELGVKGTIEKAKQLEAATKGSKFLDQTGSELNREAFRPHGRRIARKLIMLGQTENITFVDGVGTGGTWTGFTEGLWELLPNCQTVAVEVKGKEMLAKLYQKNIINLSTTDCIESETGDNFWTEEWPQASQIPGLAANIKSKANLTHLFETNTSIDPQIITVTNQTGQKAARLLAREYQHYAGISTGATFAAALTLAKSKPNSTIVIPISDLGQMYNGEIWRSQKREIVETKTTEDLIGSSITETDIVHPDQRTEHLTTKEMGGPLGTSALIDIIEIACRDLEIELGLVTRAADSVGCGFTTEIKHKKYAPLGTKLGIHAKLEKIKKTTNGKFLTFTAQVFTVNEEGGKIPISNKITHQRYLSKKMQKFRKTAGHK